jgi:nucleoside-diphosphate-sugar epimerase
VDTGSHLALTLFAHMAPGWGQTVQNAMMHDVTPRAPVLVTGVTGFVGRRLARALVARGYRVRGLTRRDTGLDDLANDGIEVVRGDLADPAALERACDGQRLVFHAAGRVSDWGPR